ncbi:cytochrome P450 [Croceitalea sp. P059]|uniref:cytochrome P450 n=1 Tax=Croceitalea sp. P059 TaxID=3075601 RepID=UPI00288532BD|nr:cytochrome P450 [Croceitalea sp. P059]MDT0539209.1 cytochrome P450 [Croceitalea sp. P059]
MKNLPQVSVFKVLRNSAQILKNPLPFHHKNFEKLGDTFEITTLGDGKLIFSRNPEVVKQVLQKKQKSFSKSKLQTKDLAKYIGHGLLTSEGEHWRTHRRMIQPKFHLKNLKSLLGIIHQAIEDELDVVEPNQEQDIFGLMGDVAFKVVAKSLFNALDIDEPMAKLKAIAEENQLMLIKEMRQPYLKWWFKVSGKIGAALNKSEMAREILNELIEQRIASQQKSTDLLDMLLEATYEDGSKMPRNQLIDELFILFTAGYETTANALSFTLYFVAKDKNLQNQLFDEVSKLDSETIKMEDLQRLSLTQSSINEAMRLYPPAYFIDRVAVEEVEIAGFQFKKNSLVLLSLYELHRYKNFWNKPASYSGSRFKDFEDKKHSDYYYPFGAGPRMCIGNAFATYEMIMVVATLIKKYHISTEMESVEINPMITLKPKEVKLRFKKRKSPSISA